MLKEVDILGVYVSPFAVHLGAAGLAYVPTRLACTRLRIERFVWHRTLFDVAIFVIYLAAAARFL